MNIEEVWREEKIALRGELQNLKNCQITFLTYSVGATGLLLGFGAGDSSSGIQRAIFLAPLILLLPAGLIFFDKATSITRIVGYYRILERLLLGRATSKNFLGWEKSLQAFRTKQDDEKREFAKNYRREFNFCKFVNTISLQSGSPYWVFSYVTFSALSLFCIFGSFVLCAGLGVEWYDYFLWGFAGLSFLFSFLRNTKILWDISQGYRSYDSNEKIWEDILDVNPRS